MGQLGIGAMLHQLSSNEDTVNAVQGSVGLIIQEVKLEDDSLKFEFTDGRKIRLFDDGQSCCESRYMTTDDDLSEFAGAKLLDMELKTGPNIEDEYGNDHEVQFLEVKTDKGSFVMSSHNEHNGYYGGFAIVAEVIE